MAFFKVKLSAVSPDSLVECQALHAGLCPWLSVPGLSEKATEGQLLPPPPGASSSVGSLEELQVLL